MIFVYLGCFLFILYYLFTKNYSYWQSKGVPFDKPFLFFGSMYKTLIGKEHLSQTFRRIYNEHATSPYVGLYLFNQPSLLIRSPEVIKRILVKDFDKFINRRAATDEKRDPLAFHNLAAARDSTWKNLRAKISPVFTSGKMKLMFPLMKECGENMQKYLEQRPFPEMGEVVKRYSVDVISSCAFGINANCLTHEKPEMLDVAKRLLDPKSFVRNFSLFCFFFAPKLMNLFKLTFTDSRASKYLVEVFKNVVQERGKNGIVRNDLIDLLDQLKKNEAGKDQYKFDDIRMAAQAIIFFTAGNDTTSLTLTFALYELTVNKDMQERLRNEIRDSFKKENGFTYEAIQGMKYMDMVLNETLRRYPLTTFLNREVAADYTFEETGMTIEKGKAIYIPTAGLHFDPQYFPDPEKFDPERFSDENKSKLTPYTFLPFGDGPRLCIGQRFAQLSAKTAIAYILKDFVLEPTDKTNMEIDRRAMFLQAKNGLHVRVRKV